MEFVPNGWVPLTTAVDRLAKHRRSADQANNDGKDATRATLRAELYGGLMPATVICPDSGKAYAIVPDRWALKEAQNWLEQGKCVLTNGLVYNRSGIRLSEDPVVKIFVTESDLQRLMAKQESLVPHDPSQPPQPVAKPDSSEKASPIEVSISVARERRRGRRKGQGSFESVDLPLLDEMKALIALGTAASPEEAARTLAPKAHGAGTLESKSERLAKRFRNRAETSGSNSLGKNRKRSVLIGRLVFR